MSGSENFLAECLRADNLGITAASTGHSWDVDLLALTALDVTDRISVLAKTKGLWISFYDERSGLWRNCSSIIWHPRFRALVANGGLELGAVDEGGRLLDRVTITTWRKQGDTLLTAKSDAAVKRVFEPAVRGPSHASISSPECIDVVYTWVNSADPEWAAAHEQFRPGSSIDADRYNQSDELRYSLRSVEMFAPWVRRIFVFSNCAPPPWFAETDRVRWIYHHDVAPDRYLPTFNSHAIETFLHHIPDLSEKFIYFNDDFFLSSPVRPEDFFTIYGQTIARLEPYGVLQYLESLTEAGLAEEWQHAAVNSARLTMRSSGALASRLHQHAPYVFKKSTFAELERLRLIEFEITRNNRFRSKTDYSVASFLYHHYALNARDAVISNDHSFIVRHTNFKRFMKRRMYKDLKFFCVNDGGGSSGNDGFSSFKKKFLSNRYPLKSRAET